MVWTGLEGMWDGGWTCRLRNVLLEQYLLRAATSVPFVFLKYIGIVFIHFWTEYLYWHMRRTRYWEGH
jgi:uncharacterized protein (DUF3820 family)